MLFYSLTKSNPTEPSQSIDNLPDEISETQIPATPKIPKSTIQNASKMPVNRDTQKIITIRGERHSGTSWLRKMITKNCPKIKYDFINQDADGRYGWKHSLIDDQALLKINKDLPDAVFVISIFRDYKTWLWKMKENNYINERIGPKSGKNVEFSKFLRENWPAWSSRTRNSDKKEPFYENILKMRTQKYKNWLKYSDLTVKYEDLLKDPENLFLKKFVDKFGLENECFEKFVKVDGYTKFNREYKGREVHEKFGEFSEEDGRFILENLDIELEKKLGYI